MGINLQSLSITQTINSIISFFNSQENNSKWKDLTTGSEGLFLIRMLANILTNISYRLVSARRENYLSTASLVSSALGIAVNQGYSAYRGSNQKRLIRLIPKDNYVVPKYTIIGNYNDTYSIITLEDYIFNKNTSIDIKTVIGTLKTLTWTAGTMDITAFQQFTQNISEDCILLLDGVEVPTTKIYRELYNDKYLVRTNPYKSVDVLYLNNLTTAQYKYGTESVFTLKYIELADVTTIPYTSDMFTYGTLSNTLTIDVYIPFETLSSIKINAPLYHEVQNVIKAKTDYINQIPQNISNIVTAGFDPVTPSYAAITYLKNDNTLLKDTEYTDLTNIFTETSGFCIPNPDTEPPRRNQISLSIILKINDAFKDTADIDTDLTSILKTYYTLKLAQTFDTEDVSRFLEDSLSYVNRAYVSYNIHERTNNENIQLGTIISINGVYYRADKVTGVTGTTEPSWNLPIDTPLSIETDLETLDGTVIWKTYKRLSNMGNKIQKWSNNTRYTLNDYVYSDSYPYYMFKCADLVKASGTTIPNVSTVSIGDFVIDNKIVWVCKEYNLSYNNWAQLTTYRLGDSVNIGTAYSFECISYTGDTDSTQPIFEIPTYPVTGCTNYTFIIEGNYTNYFLEYDIIKVNTASNTYTYSVSNSIYSVNNNQTVITVTLPINTDITYTTIVASRKGTVDNEISWQIEDNITSMTYGWNIYNSFKYTLNTKY